MDIVYTYEKLTTFGEMVMTFGVIGCVIILLFTIGYTDSKKVWIPLLCSLIIASVSMVGVHKILPRDTFHEIVISDFEEIDFDKYEIVEQRGKVITLRINK